MIDEGWSLFTITTTSSTPGGRIRPRPRLLIKGQAAPVSCASWCVVRVRWCVFGAKVERQMYPRGELVEA